MLDFDPLDFSWVEKELSTSILQQNWFKFQREELDSFGDDLVLVTEKFNKTYKQNIDKEEAFELFKKWKRYTTGAWNTIISQNKNIEDWKKAALDFESYHQQSEQRMKKWTEEREPNFPVIKTKKPIKFFHGLYFNQCIERIPKVFTTSQCYYICPGISLLVTSYDIELKFIRLDFTEDVRKLIKPENIELNPWKNRKANYVIYLRPFEIEEDFISHF